MAFDPSRPADYPNPAIVVEETLANEIDQRDSANTDIASVLAATGDDTLEDAITTINAALVNEASVLTATNTESMEDAITAIESAMDGLASIYTALGGDPAPTTPAEAVTAITALQG